MTPIYILASLGILMILLSLAICYLCKPRTATPGAIMFDLFFGLYIGFIIVAAQKTAEVYEKAPYNLKTGTSAAFFAILSVIFVIIAIRYQGDKIKSGDDGKNQTEKLIQLVDLLERGYLSRDEFNSEKAKLLNR